MYLSRSFVPVRHYLPAIWQGRIGSWRLMPGSNPASRRDDPAGRQHHASDGRAWIQQFRVNITDLLHEGR
jgi:hypothetical protein